MSNIKKSLIDDQGEVLELEAEHFEQYQKLTNQQRNIADALAMPATTDIDFTPSHVSVETKAADFL